MTTIFQHFLIIVGKKQIRYHIALGRKASERETNSVKREEEDGGHKWTPSWLNIADGRMHVPSASHSSTDMAVS